MKDNGLKEILWFVAIVVGLGILWFITGGAKNAAQSIVQPSVVTSTGQTVSEATTGANGGLLGALGDGTDNNNTVYVTGLTSANSNGSGSSAGSSGSGGSASGPSYDAADYAWIANKSPYFMEVTLSTGSIGTDDPTQEYLQLNAWSGNSGPIAITGWRLLSLITGSTATIGNGVILPYVGGTSIAQTIDLLPGDEANIITGSSPLGFSFQENECSGYFAQFNSFTPSLNYSCPTIDQNLPPPPNNFDDECLDFIQSYPECTTPTTALPPDLAGSCDDFITTHASYSQCIIDHKSDTNFYSHQWWIYLGRSQTLWKSENETIELLDANGQVVDAISY